MTGAGRQNREGRAIKRTLPDLRRAVATASVATAGMVLFSVLTPPAPAAPREPRGAVKVEVQVVEPRAPVDKAARADPRGKVALPAPVQVVPPLRNAAPNEAVIQQLAPILRSELRILTAVVQPSPAQRREIALQGGKAVKEVAKTSAAFNNGNRGAIVRNSPRNDPRKVIHTAIEKAAKAQLSPEQFDRFQRESAKKTRDRREAILLSIIVKLDRLLVLTPEQRTRLHGTLEANWDDQVYPPIDLLAAYDAWFPMIPDAQLTPVLNAIQRKVWQDAQKINFNSIRIANGFNHGMPNSGMRDEDPDVEAALGEEGQP